MHPSVSGRSPSARTGAIAPGTLFGARYHIIRPLGEGGMGCVYHAFDAELGIDVAVKVIRPEIAGDPEGAAEIERRFKRELLLARQVSHRNVVRIHDIGDINGTKYITMAYVEGADLAALLARERKLPVPRVVRLARQIAAGLRAAHDEGVVHRDLKPANIMIGPGDHAQIMDFGIARSAAAESGRTVPGAMVGTVDYMAPEQAHGKADARADIYAFGLILYDMLLGRRTAAPGENPLAGLIARMKEAPRPPRAIDPSIPEALDAIVVKCLQPDPAARYETSAGLLAALERIDDAGVPLPEPIAARLPRLWLGAAALAAALLAGAATWWTTRPPAAQAPRDPVPVLIADFENGTGDPVFEGSLEQSLTIGIEGAPFITSFRRDLALRVADAIRPGTRLDEDGAMLVAVREGIKVLLAGSVTGSESGYHLSMRALDPAGGGTLFTVSASAPGKGEVLRAVGRLASQVREQLGDAAPDNGSPPAETFTAGSLEAMRHYSQAQALSRGRDADAIEHYRAAVENDPAFGRAYAGWAISASRLGRRDEAEAAWKQALSLLDRMTEREKYRTLGGYALDFTRDFEGAVEHYRALVERFPADEAGHGNLALAYFHLLDFARALEHGRRAVAIYPSDVRFRTNLALYAMYAGDHAAASAEAARVLEHDAGFHKAYLPIAAAAMASGDFDAALRAFDGMERAGTMGASLAAIGRADFALFHGRFADAIDGLRPTLEADEAAGNASSLARKHVVMAQALAAAGDRVEALRAGRRALELSEADAIAVPVALLLVDTGHLEEAAAVARRLGAGLPAASRAYATLVDGRIAIARGKPAEAVEAFRAGLKLADLWLLRFHLGLAYLEVGPAHAAAALAEFETCLARRAETAAVFLDDVPTFRYLAAVQDAHRRAREAIGLTAAPAS